jgi:hypothetical protein
MAHGDAREGKWRGNWRMEWVASILHTTSEHGVSSITTADAHTSTASSRPNWRPRRSKWTRPFRRKTKSGFCACAITFQTQSTIILSYTAFKTTPFCNYTLLPATVEVLETFLEAILWKPFQLLRRILNDISSITKDPRPVNADLSRADNNQLERSQENMGDAPVLSHCFC